jgi:acyl carrier protein
MPYISKKVYKTGDLARWLPDGNIQFLGRKDQQIKIRGFRVETGEIENRLLKHDEIKEAVVAAREDNRGDRFLCAYVVLNQEIELPGIRESLALELPHYMIPAFFVPLNQLPLTSNGKIDRNALPEPNIEAGVEYVEPQNQAQKRLQTIWQEALVLESIGINDNFFDIGGHSLKAIQVINRIYREFNVKIPLAEMFRTPTIHGLSQYIEQAARDQFVSLEPAEKREYHALSSAQKRLYLQQQLELKSTAYNMPAVTTLNMKIEKGKPEQTFKMLFQRHEILRTSFKMINQQPVQRIHSIHQLEFTIDYDETGKEQINERVENFLNPFDLSRAPLLRMALIKTGEEEYVLMTDMHHIISDTVSYDILIRDFISLYLGEELAPLKFQYKDFSQWQTGERQKQLMKQQKLYWKKVFLSQLPVLDLPTDYPRPLVQSFAGRMTDFELEAEETGALKKIALDGGVTLFIVLLAAYNIFLAKISRQEDIIVGTATAGRNHPDLEKIMGVFLNTLALRNYPVPDKTFKNFLKEVGESTIEAFDNGDYPFEELVEMVVKTRNKSHNPIFDVRFTFNTIGQSAREMPEEQPPPNPVMHHTSKFDMTLYAQDAGEKVEFAFEYCVKIFKEETIKRFIGYFKEILSIIIKNRDIILKDIKISHDFITVKSKAHQVDLDF